MILVTGGTGLVGAHLLYKLAQENERLKASIRQTSDTSAVRKVFGYYTNNSEADFLFNKIEWIQADINDIPALEVAFSDVDYVYHCAAFISFDPTDKRKLRKINIEGTANIVNLCISRKVKKLCYVSSIAAIGSSKNGEINETAKWNPEDDHNDYAISKYGAEIEVWRGTQEGVDTVIVNPGIIIGPGFWDTGSGKIFRRIDRGLKYHFPKVTGFVGVEDVVKSMLLLMNSSVKNENFILVGENLSFEHILKETAEHLHKPKPKMQLKKWMVFLGWIFQTAASWFGYKREITRGAIRSVFSKTYYSNAKLKKAFNFDFTPVDLVIKQTSEIYRKEN